MFIFKGMKLFGKRVLPFIAIITLAHVLFFFLALRFTRIYMGDSYEYVYMALNIKDHFLFYAGNPALPLLTKNFTLRPPGYSFFLLAVYFFSVNNWLVLVLQNLVSIGNILLLRRTLFYLGYAIRYDGWLALFILAFPAQFIYANTIAPDLLLQTCVLFYFYHMVLLVRSRKVKNGWWAALALTYGVFTKPILLLFLPIHVVLMVVCLWKLPAKRTVFLSVLMPFGFVLLYNCWNLQRTGKFHFTSIQPWNAMNYNVRMYQEHALGNEQAALFMKKERTAWSAQPDFKSWYDYGNKRSMEFLKTHFWSYMGFHAQYALQFFIHPGKGEIDLFTGDLTYGRFYAKKDKRIGEILRSTPVSALPAYFRSHPTVVVMFVVLLFNFLKVVGALLYLTDAVRSWRFKLLAGALLFYFAFLTGPLANTRYQLPVSLIFIGFAVLGYQRLLQARANRRIITT